MEEKENALIVNTYKFCTECKRKVASDYTAPKDNAMAGRTFSLNKFWIKLGQLIELNLQTFNCSIFPMVAVSLDGKMVNVCVCTPISTPTLSGISQFFSGKKVTAPPSPKGPVRLWAEAFNNSCED